jgi:hypothetical protein
MGPPFPASAYQPSSTLLLLLPLLLLLLLLLLLMSHLRVQAAHAARTQARGGTATPVRTE